MSITDIKPEKIKEELSDIDGSKFIHYFFDITTKEGTKLYFHNGREDYSVNNIIYSPRSALQLREYYFEDSGQNYAIIDGIIEEKGIEKPISLIDVWIKISLMVSNELSSLFEYKCLGVEEKEKKFSLHLEPNTNKYQNQAVICYSKTCRAKFGDNKCKIDLKKFEVELQVKKIEKNILLVHEIKYENQYFKGGEIIFLLKDNRQINNIVLSQIGNVLTIKEDFLEIQGNLKGVKITPACDKKFITCCKKYDNALNFRGEPFIPSSNYLDN